jgi:DNA-binding NarL/FixJ family response regulator
VLRHGAPALDPERYSQISSLSPRQHEVLSHLLRGERVPTIAAALYLSQSTVRNHLTVIFNRFGVHSQPELLDLLSNSSGNDPPG